MRTTLNDQITAEIRKKLARANADFAAVYPGDPHERQPLHVVYGGAHLFRSNTASSLGVKALDSLRRYAPDGASLAAAAGLPVETADAVYERVVAKLEREAVEDFRIDFEDGFGFRPDREEDAEAERAAIEVHQAAERRTLPPFIGIRIKPLTEVLHARSIRTLDIFISTLLGRSGGSMPGGFVVTLPKVQVPEQVSALAGIFEILENTHNLPARSLRMEVMIETPQAIINSHGECAIPALIDAAAGRCRGAHFGSYDYTSLLNITASHQDLLHPACGQARHAMLVSLAQRGVFLSDGVTNVLPVSRDGDAAVIHRAWRLHVRHIRHSLMNGFYQGWDLHPAQLPSRYAAVYSFFLEGLPDATTRLRNFIDRAAQATLVGEVFDDAATGQGLLNFFLRGLACGALTEREVLATGLSLDELRTRSFLKILEGRLTGLARR